MAISPELTGGAGFTFEDAVVAFYLASALAEGGVRGLAEHVCKAVYVQRAALGQPLDDLIVEGVNRFGGTARLALQIKQTITVSAASSNEDFRQIVQRAWATHQMPPSSPDNNDRVGAATGKIAAEALRDVRVTCEWARNAVSAADFYARLRLPGLASEGQRDFEASVRSIVAAGSAGKPNDDVIWKFLKGFVLLRFDFRSEGAEDDYDAIERLKTVLPLDDSARSTDLWRALLDLARSLASSAGSQDRTMLIARFSSAFDFRSSRSYKHDLIKIAEETNNALESIRRDINGKVIERPRLFLEASELLQKHRFLQITGEPGSGKSTFLRLLAEHQRAQGFALVLKSDRLVGPGWPALAAHLRLQSDRLSDLLIELGATADPILYIDGIDRIIERSHKQTVLDLLHSMLANPSLVRWRVVASVRDGNIEHVRTWLPDNLTASEIVTVSVPAFDDQDSHELARVFPFLQPLLFGSPEVQEIARRPFFLNVLSRSFDRTHPPLPSSEQELIQAWWQRGGYDAERSDARRRQSTLLAVAERAALTLGRRISTAGLDDRTVNELIEDGILREAGIAQLVSFQHDIFFEWAMFQVCRSKMDRWHDVIVGAGELPGLGRVVELLSQTALERDEAWTATLKTLEVASYRSQWHRAWILGAFGSPRFNNFERVVSQALLGEQIGRLTKLLVWFQAVRTIENPLVISGQIGGDDYDRFTRMRVADALAWPRETQAWQRLLTWLFAHTQEFSVDIVLDVLSVFDIWLNAFMSVRLRNTIQIAATVHQWLVKVEEQGYSSAFPRKDTNDPSSSPSAVSWEEVESSLRGVFIRASFTSPALLAGYLDRLLADEELDERILRQLISWSPTICQTQAGKLVDLCLSSWSGPLPSELASRKEGLYSWSPSEFDWDSLSIENAFGFNPASPIQEPFRSLFQRAPREALRLVRGLCSHAQESWRQLHQYFRRAPGVPLPLELDFPWGKQAFWGDARVYTWYRGTFAPDVLSSALMALEDWAFSEIERGRDFDDLIKDVVLDNSSVAVLGIAVALALSTNHVSATTLPLVTNQRLWIYDLQRFITIDQTGMPANLIGATWSQDRSHFKELQRINARPARKLEIRQLAMIFSVASTGEIHEIFVNRLRTFPNELPFEYQEEEAHPEHVSELKRTAELWAEIGDRANFAATDAPDGSGTYIVFDNPKQSEPHVLETLARSAEMSQWLRPLNWSRRCFEEGRLIAKEIEAAVADAKKNYKPGMFQEVIGLGDLRETARRGVAGTAAALLTFVPDIDSDTLSWATQISREAAKTPLPRDGMLAPQSICPDHCGVFASFGLAALIKHHNGSHNIREALLELVNYPLYAVAHAALAKAMECWRTDERLAWVAFELGVRLSVAHKQPADAPNPDPYGGRAHVQKAIKKIRSSKTLIEKLEIPPAWELAAPSPKASSRPRRRDSDSGDVWREPYAYLRWDFLPAVLKGLPTEFVLAEQIRRETVIELAKALLSWTIEKFSPPWATSARDRAPSPPYEWRSAFLSWLAVFAAELDAADARTLFLAPILALPGKVRAEFLDSFLRVFVTAAVMDPRTVRPGVMDVLAVCFEGITLESDWHHARRNPSRPLRSELTSIIRSLFMVHVREIATGAHRFANGGYADISMIIPLVNSVLREVGDVPDVLAAFLELVERAFDFYTAENFLDQLLLVPNAVWQSRAAWAHNSNAARTAALIQSFAERAYPVETNLRAKMLAVLDRLVDIGNRRSAALQVSEMFANG